MLKTSSMVYKTLVVGVIILFCGVAVAPGFNAQIVSIKTPINKEYRYTFPDIGQEIVWDNGMNYNGLHASQRDESYPFNAITADDFQFENETIINDVHWIGGYWATGPYDFDMEIVFYYDRGDGNAPGDIYAGPFYFLNSEVNQTYIEPYYVCDFYTTLPESVIFQENQHYWISIQSVGIFPPQWGIAAHDNKFRLHECVFKCELLGHPDWTDSKIVFGVRSDICFQLIYEPNNPPSVPTIDGPTTGNPDTEYCFTFHSTDIDNNSVKYVIDWGDGQTIETSLGPSCEPVEVCHTWEEMDTFIIKAKAVDKWDAESNWSYFEVEIPRHSVTFNSLFHWFLEKFPMLERLLTLFFK